MSRGKLVPPVPTARTKYPVRIHSAKPLGGGDAPFSASMLSRAVENWQRYQSPLSRNPAVPVPQAAYIPAADVGIGHDDDQSVARAILNRTDLPSCGEPVRLWMQGPDMFADIDRMPVEVAAMCNAGQFREVSAEIYPNYRLPNGQYIGPVLRRISLLGASPARQKGLGGLPPMVYSFSEPVGKGDTRKVQQVCVFFSEGPFMDKAAALAVLQAAGIDVSAWQNADDALVIAFAQYVQQMTATGNPPPAPPATFAEQINRTVAASVAAAVAPLLIGQKQMNDRFGTLLADSERQECITFAETNKSKLFPYERDEKLDTWIVGRLMKLPPDVRKSEMAAIEKRPVMKFAEVMPDGSAGPVRPEGGTHRQYGGDGGPVSDERKRQLLSLTNGGRTLLARQAKK